MSFIPRGSPVAAPHCPHLTDKETEARTSSSGQKDGGRLGPFPVYHLARVVRPARAYCWQELSCWKPNSPVRLPEPGFSDPTVVPPVDHEPVPALVCWRSLAFPGELYAMRLKDGLQHDIGWEVSGRGEKLSCPSWRRWRRTEAPTEWRELAAVLGPLQSGPRVSQISFPRGPGAHGGRLYTAFGLKL